RDAFRERLLAIASAWDTHRQEALDAADGIQKLLVEQQRPPDPAGRAVPADLLLRDSARELALTFDRANGGFGGRPKFPPHGALWLLLQKHARSRDAGALEMVVRTLDGMARGGLYDQIGGGFHRYATDERWLVPHFEKMLYDNALLVPIYLEAWKVTGRIRFRRVAEETLAWVMREMADPGGGFCAALDADSEGREGAYYLWTADEVKGIVGPTDSALVIAYYGLTDGGRFEGGGSLPHVARSIDQLARERGLPEDVTRARLESARQKLMRARSRRVPPRRDGKILTAWNGLMISALARAYESTGVARYRAAAIGAADFLRLHIAGPDGSLRVSWTDGRPGPPGHLDDSAFLGRGLLDLHDVTGDERFLDLAALILGSASRFYDVRDGGYFFAEGGRPDLIVRTRSLDDGPLPSGSAVMVDCLARLSRALGDPSLLGPAARTLALAAPALQRSPLASPYMVLAALRMVGEEGGGASPPPARTAVAPGSLRDAPVLAAERTGAALPAGALGSAGVSHAGTAGTGEPPERLIRGSVVGRAGPQRVVESSILAPAGAVRPGQSVTLSVRLSIDRGWHVNSSRPTLSYLIPTRIEFPAPAAANVEEIAYPEGTLVSLKFADQKLSVFQGETTIRATISPPAGAPAGALAVKARLTYQACSDLACLAPETVEFAIPIRVEGEPVTRAQAPPGGSGPATAPPGGPASPAGGGIGALLGSGSKGGEGIKALLEERGLLMLLGVVFLAGLALNLTPCVYPMIPVTIGFFVNQASGSWRRRIGLPALYVLG
ncbi:MAG TPA: protein-disulfide reductase DsbD domain-containing protein, partial [Candidatus Polarisedimenticolia bacterium]|nr:protein-disulfide reductase DsbD domain-containing protein [Candidatus Polarisedimenticolia bacterium]